MTVKAVVFDMGNVLVDWDPRHLYRKLIDDEAQMEYFLAEICTMDWHFEHDQGGKSFKENADLLSAQHPEHEDLIRAWGNRWLEMVKGRIEGTFDLIDQLKAAGYGLVGLTNVPDEQFDDLRAAYGLFEGFDDVIVSGREKCAKPDPAIYELTERRAGLAGAELAFLDDLPKNIATANDRGWHGIVFEHPDQATRDLKALGLTF
ncbi:MAG: HAD family hydrolase [Alphaproteobacteria bacterium]